MKIRAIDMGNTALTCRAAHVPYREKAFRKGWFGANTGGSVVLQRVNTTSNQTDGPSWDSQVGIGATNPLTG